MWVHSFKRFIWLRPRSIWLLARSVRVTKRRTAAGWAWTPCASLRLGASCAGLEVTRQVNCASSIRGNAGVTNFNRDPGPLRLAGIRAPDAHSITGWLRDVSAAGGLLAADLSLGAWRHFQVACDFFAQLGLEDPISRLLASRRLDPAVREGAPARGVGHLIDRETLGDSTVLDAFRLAREAKGVKDGAVPKCFAIDKVTDSSCRSPFTNCRVQTPTCEEPRNRVFESQLRKEVARDLEVPPRPET